MELYAFSLLAVLVLAVIIFKSISCWISCSKPEASKEIKKFIEKRKKELSASKGQLVQLEIPMGDIERTSTPVPKEERKSPSRSDTIQSDV